MPTPSAPRRTTPPRSPTSACATTSPSRSPASTRATAPSCRPCSARCRSLRSGAQSARRRAAIASSCSATSTSSGMPHPAPKRSSSSRPSTPSTPSGSTARLCASTIDALLEWMLDGFGFTADERPGVLITIDKLDKIRAEGVVAELRERGATAAAVDALEQFLSRPMTMEYNPYGERQIRKLLPADAPEEIVRDLVAIGEAVAAARPRGRRGERHPAGVRSVPRAGHGVLHGHDLRARPPLRGLLARRRRPLRRHDRPLPRAGRPRGGLLDRLRAARRARRSGRRTQRSRASCSSTTAMSRSETCSH